jgi:hypothetical protein
MRSSTSSSEAALPAGLVLPRASAERATAADRPGVAQPVPERPVPPRPWPAVLACALAVALALLAGWEAYWRADGAPTGYYRDDAALWAIEWRTVRANPDATVLVGASRTHFDVQLPVWEKLSGRRPIQLAIEGTSPVVALENLAAEPAFHGRVLVGIAPDIFFTGLEFQRSMMTFWRTESPSERVGKWLSMHLAEPWFAFFDPDYALFKVYARLPLPDRPGKPTGLRVRRLKNTEADRNAFMWDRLETDTAYRELARRTWAEDLEPPTADELARNRKAADEAVTRAAAAVATLRARGVPVVFVREPSTGPYLAFEDRWFPRRDTWDVLLARTGAPGIHFEDYPELRSGYELPEWSHMNRRSAERWTDALWHRLQADHGGGQRW